MFERRGPTIEFLTIRRTDRFGVPCRKRRRGLQCVCICAWCIRGKSRVHTHGQKDSPVGDEADSHAHERFGRLWDNARILPRTTSNVKSIRARTAHYSLSLYNMRNELCAMPSRQTFHLQCFSFIAYFYYILLLCVSTASPIAILMALLHR